MLRVLLAHDLNHGILALRVGPGEFLVGSGIGKPDFGSVLGEIAEEKVTVPEFEAAKFLASVADGQPFSVRGGIIHRSDLIYAFGYDLAFFHDDATERLTASGTDIFERELDGAGQEGVALAFGLRHRRLTSTDPRDICTLFHFPFSKAAKCLQPQAQTCAPVGTAIAFISRVLVDGKLCRERE